MAIRQVSVFIENRKGALADPLRVLSDAGIGLRALSIADTSDFGILRIITDDNTKAAYQLCEQGYICSVTDVVAACADDKPGGLAALLTILSDAGVDVEYVYAFVAKTGNHAWVVMRVNNNAEAERILSENNITLVSEADIAADLMLEDGMACTPGGINFAERVGHFEKIIDRSIINLRSFGIRARATTERDRDKLYITICIE